MSHTYALLEVSAEAYDEIAAKLREAGYDHAFGEEGEIDMHGLALTRGSQQRPPTAGACGGQLDRHGRTNKNGTEAAADAV